jgi:hypothetical protein
METKGITIFLIAVILIVGLAGCQTNEDDSHVFAVAENDFELRGCIWNIHLEKVDTAIYQLLEDETYGNTYRPDLGYFYVIHVSIKPGDQPYLSLKDIRYQMVDVHGTKYLPTTRYTATGEYAKQTGLTDLLLTRKTSVDEKVEGFIIIDGAGKLQGLTLEIFHTGETPEKKLAIVDLKQ